MRSRTGIARRSNGRRSCAALFGGADHRACAAGTGRRARRHSMTDPRLSRPPAIRTVAPTKALPTRGRAAVPVTVCPARDRTSRVNPSSAPYDTRTEPQKAA